ncbi:MAG: TQXA domain-containing protein [Pseudonocardiaceae bacterium]|nr:TQXA domain-containing protein [Pseudonocardiaceae bacterium]
MGRSNLVRAGAAIIGASVTVMLAGAVPAGAQTDASLDHQNTAGLSVNMVDKGRLTTKLIGLGTAGKHFDTYCVEIDTSIDPNHPDMTEVPWDSYPDDESPFHKNRAKVNWVLHHSYPAVELDKLSETVDADFVNGLNKQEAIAATQAAVWHFSDDVDLDKTQPTRNPTSDADVLALYEYLTGDENTGINEPQPVLEVKPDKQSGTAGERIGPFTVSSTAEVVEVLTEFPEGVKLTDKDGNELPRADVEKKVQEQDSYDIYVDVPESAEPGGGKFTLKAEAPLSLGRLFIGKEYQKHPTQSLILAKSDKTKLSANAEAEWEAAAPPTTSTTTSAPTSSSAPSQPSPTETTSSPAAAAPAVDNTGGLAQTGASIFWPIVIGLVLLGAGAGTLLFRRLRRNS